jgi:hypothetical protein
MQMFSFGVLMVSYLLQEFVFLPTFLGYLKGHRWGAPTVFRENHIIFFKLNLACCVTDNFSISVLLTASDYDKIRAFHCRHPLFYSCNYTGLEFCL